MKEHRRYPGSFASTAAVASMLLCPLAWSAPGDLDPAFGDIGRATELPGLLGDVWSIEPHGDAFVLGGGGLAPSDDPEITLSFGFTARIAQNGSIDPNFAGAIPQDLIVHDVATLSDGRVIGVGRGFTAFRLTASGALDATFGEGGFAQGPAEMDLFTGASVVLDDSGRAVIAGSSGRSLAVFRLLPNGEMDDSFGDAGVFTWSGNRTLISRPRLLRIPDGYRVILNSFVLPSPDIPSPRSFKCRVVALRDDGGLDTTFGAAGFVDLGELSICAGLAAQPDGGLVIARNGVTAIRLSASGERDASFNTEEATAGMSGITALAAASDGSLLMAGPGDTGISGSLVVRLRADGMRDASFGDVGATWVDLPSSTGVQTVYDILPLAEGDIVLAGGVPDAAGLGHPFVARLLGNSGMDGPGVVGVKRFLIDATSNPNQAVVAVRRTGGRAGAMSVAYRTWTSPDAASPAAEGQNYVATSGRLTWADQDSQEKEIVVQLLGEIDGNPENDRTFEVQLSDVQGGGLGSTIATVNTGFLAAILRIDPTDLTVDESQGTISLNLVRDTNVAGVVSATVTASADTAIADSDYRFEPTIIEWADGDASIKTVSIPIVDDDAQESSESFTVSITGATNGALIGDPSVTRITINDDDQDDNSGGGSQGGSSGGGQFGLFPMILLGFAGVFRAVQQRLSRRSAFQKE